MCLLCPIHIWAYELYITKIIITWYKISYELCFFEFLMNNEHEKLIMALEVTHKSLLLLIYHLFVFYIRNSWNFNELIIIWDEIIVFIIITYDHWPLIWLMLLFIILNLNLIQYAWMLLHRVIIIIIIIIRFSVWNGRYIMGICFFFWQRS